MEMGISITEETRPAPNAEQHVQAEHIQTNHVQTPNSVRKSSSSSSSTTAASNFFQKIASKTKLMKRSPIQMYANIDIDNAIGAMPSNRQSTNSKFTTNSPKFSPNSPIHHQEIYRNPDHILLDHQNQSASNNNNNSSTEGEQAEEHILPDSFDEVSHIHHIEKNGGNGDEKSSVSPSSRKSASSHASRGSQDSGIGIPINKTGTGNVIVTNQDNVRSPTGNTVVMQVASTSHGHSNKRTADFSKAWYDVPSDDETEAPEADSLASIISHRGSSDDEN
jgi:hypothetical protein